jgi:hypothetical protein
MTESEYDMYSNEVSYPVSNTYSEVLYQKHKRNEFTCTYKTLIVLMCLVVGMSLPCLLFKFILAYNCPLFAYDFSKWIEEQCPISPKAHKHNIVSGQFYNVSQCCNMHHFIIDNLLSSNGTKLITTSEDADNDKLLLSYILAKLQTNSKVLSSSVQDNNMYEMSDKSGSKYILQHYYNPATDIDRYFTNDLVSYYAIHGDMCNIIVMHNTQGIALYNKQCLNGICIGWSFLASIWFMAFITTVCFCFAICIRVCRLYNKDT